MFFFQTNLYSYERVYEYEVPDEINIIFKNYKKHLFQIDKAFKHPNPKGKKYIRDKYKRPTQIKGTYFNHYNNEEINFKGKARITGDWLDHISIKEMISSLSISLDYGNVGGVTRFRLLLPKTRNMENEILWSILMEEIGFAVPYRKFIKVNLMGVKKIFIFEERAEKEFLESWGFRETPIIEYDEREIWANGIFSYIGKRNYLLEETKKNWISYDKFKIENANFIKNKTSKTISYLSLNPNFKLDSKAAKLFHKINAKYGEHGLAMHNRKYIYDAIYNDYIPVYFDGNIDIPNNICEKKPELNYSNDKKKFEIIKQKYIDRTLGSSKFTKQMGCLVNEIILISKENSSSLNEIKSLDKIDYDYGKHTNKISQEKNLKYRPPVYNYDHKTGKLEKCFYDSADKKWNYCEKQKDFLIKKAFLGNDDFFQPNNINYKYTIPININYKPFFKEEFKKIKAINDTVNIYTNKNQITYLNIQSNNSKINIELNDHTSFVVIYKSEINNSEININTKNKTSSISDSRYNEKLLTGCSTVIDSEINNSFLSSKNCNNEDGLNFIRVHGKKISLDVKDALYDGFDADFSNLDFDKIKINNAGNDCIDISAGIYNFNTLILEKCGDKGLSIGEKSISSINYINVFNSNIGVASKDLSVAHISKIISKNVKDCLEIYHKKQEYGNGKIYLYDNKDNICEISKIKNLFILKNDFCIKVNRNYFYSTCLTKKKIKININQKNISKYDFFLKNNLGNEIKIKLNNKKKNCESYKLNCVYEIDNKDLNYVSILLKNENIVINELIL